MILTISVNYFKLQFKRLAFERQRTERLEEAEARRTFNRIIKKYEEDRKTKVLATLRNGRHDLLGSFRNF